MYTYFIKNTLNYGLYLNKKIDRNYMKIKKYKQKDYRIREDIYQLTLGFIIRFSLFHIYLHEPKVKVSDRKRNKRAKEHIPYFPNH